MWKERMQRRTISSAYTFWMKYVFPCLWIPGFGGGAFILWFDLARGKHGELPPVGMKYAFATIWVLGTTFILWIALRIKRVQMDGANLYVSKWFQEITIPLRAIVKVTEIKWIKGHPVTIYFKEATACGDKVMFLPTLRLRFWYQHPIVAELKKSADLNPDSE
jgi:hypothetical protein